MTPTEINKIVETIAGAMGDEITRIDGIPYFQGHVFNPHDSIQAVDVICPEGELEIIFYRNSNKSWTCSIWHYRDELYIAEAETPQAAVSLALVEYIKEK